MTAAKSKQATGMVTAGTPLTEVTEVLGISRTGLYRHLRTVRPEWVRSKAQERQSAGVL